jgi:hypothetical protein
LISLKTLSQRGTGTYSPAKDPERAKPRLMQTPVRWSAVLAFIERSDRGVSLSLTVLLLEFPAADIARTSPENIFALLNKSAFIKMRRTPRDEVSHPSKPFAVNVLEESTDITKTKKYERLNDR